MLEKGESLSKFFVKSFGIGFCTGKSTKMLQRLSFTSSFSLALFNYGSSLIDNRFTDIAKVRVFIVLTLELLL